MKIRSMGLVSLSAASLFAATATMLCAFDQQLHEGRASLLPMP